MSKVSLKYIQLMRSITARDGWMLAYLHLGFSVLVSNTTRMEDWILCSSFTQYTALTVPWFLALHVQCVVPTRFVIFYIHRELSHLLISKGELKLCEVRVYGKHMYSMNIKITSRFRQTWLSYDWLIDYIVFYAASAIFRPHNGGHGCHILTKNMFNVCVWRFHTYHLNF